LPPSLGGIIFEISTSKHYFFMLLLAYDQSIADNLGSNVKGREGGREGGEGGDRERGERRE
jgi:hypothetical protein